MYCTLLYNIVMYCAVLFTLLANSLDYPQRMRIEWTQLLANSLVYPERIQRGIEWTQFLKRVFFIGQLPRVSREDPERIEWTQFLKRVFFICLLVCQQIFSFSLFQPSLFIQYSTEECSTVQVFIWCLDTIA